MFCLQSSIAILVYNDWYTVSISVTVRLQTFPKKIVLIFYQLSTGNGILGSPKLPKQHLVFWPHFMTRTPAKLLDMFIPLIAHPELLLHAWVRLARHGRGPDPISSPRRLRRKGDGATRASTSGLSGAWMGSLSPGSDEWDWQGVFRSVGVVGTVNVWKNAIQGWFGYGVNEIS